MKDVCGIKLYTIKELIEMSGLCKNKVYDLLKDHTIEYIDFHGSKRVTEQQIKDAMVKLTVREKTSKLYPKGN